MEINVFYFSFLHILSIFSANLKYQNEAKILLKMKWNMFNSTNKLTSFSAVPSWTRSTGGQIDRKIEIERKNKNLYR